jgi:putative tricarboxylic transport membrane protein
MQERRPAAWPQVGVGAGVLLLGLLLAAGALAIPAAAGYGGVGPNFLPWVVAFGLVGCGLLILREAWSGGFRAMDRDTSAAHAHWPGLAWISAGLLVNAALITRVGFVFGCTLCYLLAVQGLRRAAGEPAGRPRTLAIDLASGLALSAPVYWLFTRLLGIQLPGLTGTGWL